ATTSGAADSAKNADWTPLKGRDVIIWPDNDAAGFRYAYEVVRQLTGVAASIKVIDVTALGLREHGDAVDWFAGDREARDLQVLIESAKVPVNGTAITDIAYRRVSDIQARPIHWLWPGKIARAKPTLIAGNPGLGKSQITVSLAAVVSTGGHWPVDRTPCEPGNVVILSAEDAPEDTIKPRLMAAGADLDRCFILEGVYDTKQDGTQVRRAFTLRRDIDRLAAILREIGNVALVIVDPISAYLSGTDSHNNAEVRAALAPLAELADQHGAAIVVVSHLNKGGGTDPLCRVTGSLAFVAAARAAFIVTVDPGDEKRRLFLAMKNNLAECREGLAFRVEGCKAGKIETSRVSWEAEGVTITADEALNLLPDDGRTALDDCKEWLKDFLLFGGQTEKNEIMKHGEKQGFSERTIHRARKALNLIVETTGFGREKRSAWSLLGQSCQPPCPQVGTIETWQETRANTTAPGDGDPQSCHVPEVGTNGMDGAQVEEEF
ncbi:MAG: AAA family ATPase, partial [Lentisphaerae bacterium]|nr:AAA family ATPase [Lentisphaerota bacterium]